MVGDSNGRAVIAGPRAPSCQESKPPPMSTSMCHWSAWGLNLTTTLPLTGAKTEAQRREGTSPRSHSFYAAEQASEPRKSDLRAQAQFPASPALAPSCSKSLGGGGSISAPYPLIQRWPGWVTRGLTLVFQHTPQLHSRLT